MAPFRGIDAVGGGGEKSGKAILPSGLRSCRDPRTKHPRRQLSSALAGGGEERHCVPLGTPAGEKGNAKEQFQDIKRRR